MTASAVDFYKGFGQSAKQVFKDLGVKDCVGRSGFLQARVFFIFTKSEYVDLIQLGKAGALMKLLCQHRKISQISLLLDSIEALQPIEMHPRAGSFMMHGVTLKRMGYNVSDSVSKAFETSKAVISAQIDEVTKKIQQLSVKDNKEVVSEEERKHASEELNGILKKYQEALSQILDAHLTQQASSLQRCVKQLVGELRQKEIVVCVVANEIFQYIQKDLIEGSIGVVMEPSTIEENDKLLLSLNLQAGNKSSRRFFLQLKGGVMDFDESMFQNPDQVKPGDEVTFTDQSLNMAPHIPDGSTLLQKDKRYKVVKIV